MKSSPPTKPLSLGAFVKAQRRAAQLSQRELALRAGVGLRFVRELERDKPSLQLNSVNQVLQLFGYELGPVPMDRQKFIDAER
ncbi:MAG: helix-turn-helix domain-containing protein [Schleiferiaceae bacterium]|nr:helix-turn-helix domain-containing protein [Schleiferiaceae bacterium]